MWSVSIDVYGCVTTGEAIRLYIVSFFHYLHHCGIVLTEVSSQDPINPFKLLTFKKMQLGRAESVSRNHIQTSETVHLVTSPPHGVGSRDEQSLQF